MTGAEGYHRVNEGFQRLADTSLQDMTFNGQDQSSPRRQLPGMAGNRQANLLGGDGAARGLDTHDPAVFDVEARYLAILDEIDAARIGPRA